MLAFFIVNSGYCQSITFEKVISRSNYYVEAHDMIKSHDDNFMILGSKINGNGFRNIFVIKITGQGDTLWTRYYGGNTDTRAYDISAIDEYHYIIAGEFNDNAYLLKINEEGDSLWSFIVSYYYYNYYSAALRLQDSGFALVEMRSDENYPMIAPDAYLRKMDASFDSVWTSTLGNGTLYDLILTDDNHLLISGSDATQNCHPFIAKYDLDGNNIFSVIHTNIYGSGLSAIQGDDDCFYMVGNDWMWGYSYLNKWSSTGSGLWQQKYLPADNSHANSICAIDNDHLAITGHYLDKLYILITNTIGDSLGAIDFNHHIYQSGKCILADDNDLYITSDQKETDTTFSLSFIKTSIDSILVAISEPESDFKGIEIFPNPAGHYFIVEYDLRETEGKAVIFLSDLNGRLVGNIIPDGKQNQQLISTNTFAPGMYILQLFINNELMETHKIDIIK